MRRGVPDGADTGSVGQVIVAGVGDAERIADCRTEGREWVIESAGISVSGMSSESCWMRIERYRAHEALPRVPMRPYVRLCAPAAMTVCL
jgi:hypothetical protein